MVEIENKIGDRIYVFNRLLTENEKLLNDLEIKNLIGYITDYPFIPQYIPKYDIDFLIDEATKYQYEYFDSLGTTYLLNLKMTLMLSGISLENNLVYEMIKAVECFISKLWREYDKYKIMLANKQDFICDYSTVGLPPCKLADIKWIVDSSYRDIDSNRIVIDDIDYYKNYIAQNK